MIDKIIIKAKKSAFNQRLGNNLSKFEGEGFNFNQLSLYEGGDAKKINWKAGAKTGEVYINLFSEERELSVVCAVFLSPSLHFGSKILKKELLAQVTAILGFNAIKNKDLFSSYIFSQNLSLINKPSKKVHTIYKTIKDIIDFDTIGQDLDINLAIAKLNKRLNKKSIIILLGDFLDIPNLNLLSKKHDIYSIIIREHLEENPSLINKSLLIDTKNLASYRYKFK